MAGVDADGVAIAGDPLVKVLVGKVLVAAQRVGVGQRRVQLQGALEVAQRGLVLLWGAGGWVGGWAAQLRVNSVAGGRVGGREFAWRVRERVVEMHGLVMSVAECDQQSVTHGCHSPRRYQGSLALRSCLHPTPAGPVLVCETWARLVR